MGLAIGGPVVGGSINRPAFGGSSAGAAPVSPLSSMIQKITGGTGGGGGAGGAGGAGGTGGGLRPLGGTMTRTGTPTYQSYQTPEVPEFNNTTTPDPNLSKLWDQYQGALGESNPRMDQLWNQYQDQLSTSNLDRLQDVTGSKIRDRYEGARGTLNEDLARRGMLDSGAALELGSQLGNQELQALAGSDAQLALADQNRRDQLILSGMPMASYERDRVDRLLAQGVPLASALHQLANEDKSLGLQQWQTMLGAQLAREQFGLQRDIAANSAQAQQQAQMISLIGALAPLF